MSKLKINNDKQKKHLKKSKDIKQNRIQLRRSTRVRTSIHHADDDDDNDHRILVSSHSTSLSFVSPKKKRERKASLKLLESLTQEKEEKEEKKKKKSTKTTTTASTATTTATTTTKPRKNGRNNKNDLSSATNSLTTVASAIDGKLKHETIHEDDEHDDGTYNDFEDMVCCICRCSVDYSDKDHFYWPLQEQDSGDKEEKGEEEEEDKSSASDFYGVKLPRDAYDPNNALVLCDGEGCNRCFHQRCHFIPILSIPRGKWYCLICQYKNKMRGEKHRYKNNAKCNKSPLRALAKHNVGGSTACCETLNHSRSLTMEELDQIYNHNVVDVDVDDDDSGDSKLRLLEERFEYHSAQMKAELLRKGSQQLVKMIDHYLSSIRLCQNSIRAHTEANRRTRNAIIEKYMKTKQLPQEIVQNVKRLADCKLKLRQVMQTLQSFIRNKDDRKYLEEWCIRAKKGIFSPAKITTSSGTTSDPPVPAVISLETTMTMTNENIDNDPCNGVENELDVGVVEAKLFVGQPIRHEPRFDLKDYDADADDDSESDDPISKIKCCMCFSGHVEDNNDVLMCDGQHCFRAFHMKCCAPHVTQKMLDEDENGVWFCPYCVCFAKTIHYVENEYLCHDIGGDDASKSSWDDAEDVFPEALSELEAAKSWKEGKCNYNSEKVLSEMLGIEIDKGLKNDEEQQLDGDDESDATFVSKVMSENSVSSSGSNSDGCSEVDWKVDKSEISALSCSEDELSVNHESDRKETGVRKSKRLKVMNSRNDGKSERSADIGALDTSNIIYGKRNRSKVDYNRLNDSMFGKVKASLIDDEEEYQVALEKREEDSCCSSADTSQSS